jgi:hypothetical protein
MAKDDIYLDTYILQRDMRIRLPKTIISNMGVVKGQTMFDIFLNTSDNSLIFRVHEEEKEMKK